MGGSGSDSQEDVAGSGRSTGSSSSPGEGRPAPVIAWELVRVFRCWYPMAMAVQHRVGAAENLLHGMVIELEREMFYLLWELHLELEDPVEQPGAGFSLCPG